MKNQSSLRPETAYHILYYPRRLTDTKFDNGFDWALEVSVISRSVQPAFSKACASAKSSQDTPTALARFLLARVRQNQTPCEANMPVSMAELSCGISPYSVCCSLTVRSLNLHCSNEVQLMISISSWTTTLHLSLARLRNRHWTEVYRAL